MHLKRLLAGLGALLFVSIGFGAMAAPPQSISFDVGVCDPFYPLRCIKVNADGSLNFGGSLGVNASSTPTPITAGTGKSLNEGLFSNLFTSLVDPVTGSFIDLSAPSQLAAGEAHVGEVGGNQATVAVTPTVTATTYTTGQAIGALQTVAGAERVAGKGGLIQSAVLALKVANTVAVDVFYFNASPSGSTCTNASAFVLAAADIGKVVAVAHITDWTAGNTASVGQSQNMAAPYVLPSGTSLFACAVARGSITTTGTADLSETANLIRN